MPFILASASPRRLALLKQIGIDPARVVAPEIDESPLKNELPEAYAKRIAREKAQTMAAKFAGEAILAADTVVACGRRILPKAETEAEARHCLQLLSGRRHRVYTAVAFIDAKGKLHERICMTVVQFRHLPEKIIQEYLASGEWQGKAGGYAIQGRAAAFVIRINGNYDNVVGLPLAIVANLLKA